MKISVLFAVIITFFTSIIVLTSSCNLFAQDDDSFCETRIITTTGGPVCGTIVDTSTGMKAQAFLGIPFANSTGGENRYKAPVPADTWEKILVADDFGPSCPEEGSIGVPQSEDCLSINVWIPEGTEANSDLPVMTFIYGGAFINGTSAHPLYNGSYIAANEDVIIVTFNYRLGSFGFLVTDEVEGNFGILDQQLALTWVNENIKNFGGNPEKVTIFGESAGAMSVGIHLVSAPASDGLFRAGIMESNPFGLPFKNSDEAKDLGNIFQSMGGCDNVECLREKTIEELVSFEDFLEGNKDTIFSGWLYNLTWGPIVDGTIITKSPIIGVADGDLTKPVILGTNLNEGELFEALIELAVSREEDDGFSFDEYIAWLASQYGNDLNRVETKYPGIKDGSNETPTANIFTDHMFTCSNRHFAKEAVENGTVVYTYQFIHQPSFNFSCLEECEEAVCHMEELPFVFHSADKLDKCIRNRLGSLRKTGFQFTEEEEMLSKSMIRFWTNFAKDLDPNGASESNSESTWPAFTANDPSYIIFDSIPLVTKTDPFQDICEFWDTFGYVVKKPDFSKD